VSIFGKPKSSQAQREAFQGEVSSSSSSKSRTTVISQGTVIKGEISSNDSIMIDGQVEGNVTVKNTVTIGKSGRISANVTATTLQIYGKIIGDVIASEKVCIEHSGSVEGNIHSPKLMISEGAHFKGNIDMSQMGSGSGGAAMLKAPQTGGEKKKFALRNGSQAAIQVDS